MFQMYINKFDLPWSFPAALVANMVWRSVFESTKIHAATVIALAGFGLNLLPSKTISPPESFAAYPHVKLPLTNVRLPSSWASLWYGPSSYTIFLCVSTLSKLIYARRHSGSRIKQ